MKKSEFVKCKGLKCFYCKKVILPKGKIKKLMLIKTKPYTLFDKKSNYYHFCSKKCIAGWCGG